MTTTTNAATPCTALAIIDTHAQRIRAAIARHTLPTLDPITLPDHMPTTTDAERAANIYTTAHAAVAVCLRARDMYGTGNARMIADLRRLWGADHHWQAAADMSQAADLMRVQAEQERDQAHDLTAEADRLDKTADKLTTSTTDREKLTKAAATMRKEAAKHNEAAKRLTADALDIDKHLATLTASDREDIVHTAAAAVMACTYSDTESDVFGKTCRAAGKLIDAHRAARAGGYKTKVHHMGDTLTNGKVTHRASEEENAAAYDAWCKQYPGAVKVPFAVREGTAAGYYTAEWRDSKQFPAGYYRISHYVTEAAAELAAAMDLTKPQRVNNADVVELVKAAGLTSRQRVALAVLTIATGAAKPTSTDPAKLTTYRKAAALVIKAGREAVADHDQQTAAAVALLDTPAKRQRKERDRAKVRAKVRAAAMLDKALTLAGVPAAALAMERKRLRDRLTAAMETQRKASTKAASPAALDALKLWTDAAALMEDSRHPYPGHLASLTYTSTTTGRAAALDMVWSGRYDPSTAHTLTAAEVEQDTAAEIAARATHAEERAALAYRAAVMNHTPGKDCRAAFHALDAKAAAAVFMADLTPDELHTMGAALIAEAAAAKAEQERRREIIKAAERVTLDAWRKMTKAERAAVVAMLDSLNK